MFRFVRPGPRALAAFVAEQATRPFSYAAVGATRGAAAPPGYVVDHNRALVGGGAADFARAVAALRAWRMFAVGWCALYPAAAPVAVGTTVAVVARHFGFWSANASRVVYTLDEERDGVRRVGFAYGTLPGHGARGEERFVVEWDRADDRVWYDLYAFSRPAHPLARLGRPLARALQRRFARDSKRAMVGAVR